MNQQEATREGTVSRLRAGSTVKDIMTYGDCSNPSHNSKRTQDWLKKNPTEVCKKEIWPPSSPYCNPVEYFAWGVYELRVSKS